MANTTYDKELSNHNNPSANKSYKPQVLVDSTGTMIDLNIDAKTLQSKDVVTSITGSTNIPTDSAVKTYVDNKQVSNSDKVDNLHMLDQTYAYLGYLEIEIGCANAIVHTGLTESEIFALSGSRYGELWLSSDTNKYWRKKNTTATASSANWRNDTDTVNASLLLPNQLTTIEDYVYIRVDLKQKYYSKLPKFFVEATYDNINGSTSVVGFCRQQNQFDITSCSYNGNNLLGVYQETANTDTYIFKFKKYASTYGASSQITMNPRIYYNQYSGTPAITFIGNTHADYNTVKAYSYIDVPAYGNRRTAINGHFLPISSNAYNLGSASLYWNNIYGKTIYENGTSLTNKYIAKTLTSTAGDMIYASSANTPARLGIGTNGQFLKSDGSKPVWTTVTIPTVNNATLTVTQNGTSKGTFTANASSDVTIALTDTTYESKSASQSGTDVSLVTTGEKYTWNNKQDALSTQTAYTSKGSATKVPQITTNTLGQVTGITEVTITDNNTTYTIATGDNNGQIKVTPSSGSAYNVNVKGLGTAAYKNTGTSSGNVPVLDSNGKLDESVIPAVAITDTFVVNSQAAMLALTAQKGDIAIRSDLNKSFVLQSTPASTLANWKELLTPTDTVLSVNGKTGVVTLDANDVGAISEDTEFHIGTDTTGDVSVLSDVTYTSASASGTATFLKGVKASGTAKAGSETHTHNYDKTTGVSLTANDETATGRITYVQSISNTGASGSGKYMHFSAGTTPPSSAIPSHTSTTSGANSGTAIAAVTGYASFSGGSGSLTSNDTSTDGIAYIASASHTAASLGTASTGTVTISNGSYSLSGSRSTSGSGTSARRTLTLSLSGSAPSLGGTTTFVTDYPNFSGGSGSHTTKYLHHSHTGASLGSPSTSDVAPSGHTHSYDKTTSVSLTGGTAPSMTYNSTASGGEYFVNSVSGGTTTATTKYLSASPSNTSTATNGPSATTTFVTGVTSDGTGTGVTGITAGSLTKTTSNLVIEKTTPSAGFNNIHIELNRVYQMNMGMKVNDGAEESVTTATTLNNVTKLELYGYGADNNHIDIGTTSGGSNIATVTNGFAWVDVTQYLQDGCYLTLYSHD